MLNRRDLIAGGLKAAVVATSSFSTGCSSLFYPASQAVNYDLVVYGGTPAGVIAALAGSRGNLQAALVEPTQHVGGMLASGLGQTDSLHTSYIGGLAATFYDSVGAFYGSKTPGYFYEPHVAEAIFVNMLAAANVHVYFGAYLSAVTSSNGAIQQIQLSNGLSLKGSMWVDASYEGDLLAAAGVSYSVGREAVETYGEPHAGWARSNIDTNISAIQSDGAVIPFVTANPDEVKGQADAKIMAYSFRCCTTTVAANRLPFPQPDNYDPANYIGLQRSIEVNGLNKLSDIVTMSPTIKDKYDLLRTENPFSVNFIGGGWSYPEANEATRVQIIQQHYDYVAGWLHYVATDPSIPASIQSELNRYGLAKDEFAANGNWPYQLYIREARRMLGQYVMSETDITTAIKKPDAVAIGTWYGDCHPCDLYASGSGESATTFVEGELDISAGPYEIPYGCMLPKRGEASNLAVVCCPSSSHVGFSSLRVEPTFMMLGEAAGVAASLAQLSAKSYSAVDVDLLQSTLRAHGGIPNL